VSDDALIDENGFLNLRVKSFDHFAKKFLSTRLEHKFRTLKSIRIILHKGLDDIFLKRLRLFLEDGGAWNFARWSRDILP